MKASYQGTMHTDPDTSNLVWHVAKKVCKLKLQTKITKRNGVQPKPITDLQGIGWQKFESSSLATFNKKIQDLKAGNPAEGETDDISSPSFHIEITANDID